jgi:hypothetical protein
LFFLLSLAWAIYQAIANRNPLPTWIWLDIVVESGLGKIVLA